MREKNVNCKKKFVQTNKNIDFAGIGLSTKPKSLKHHFRDPHWGDRMDTFEFLLAVLCLNISVLILTCALSRFVKVATIRFIINAQDI